MAKITRQFPVVQLHNISMEESEVPYFAVLEPLLVIPTHLSFEERLKLYQIGMALLPEQFVACEIGSYIGASTSFLGAAASHRKGQVHAVDTWMNDAMPGAAAQDTWQEFLKNTEPFRQWITPHRGTSQQVAENVPPLDFLFVDGDHSHAAVLADLQTFVPKLKPGGLLALHDFHYESVQTAVQAYFGSRPLQDRGRVNSLQLFAPQ